MAEKILVVEDEISLQETLAYNLKREGYFVATVGDGESALITARQMNPDLIVLDIMLPGMDGIEVLSQLRRESDVYVIMLTAKSEETDKIVGLSVGADDYLTKPFSPRELMARIKAALRRIQSGAHHLQHEVISAKHLRIDPGGRQVWVDEQPIELTTTEFDLLLILAENRGMVVSREQLLEKVWGTNFYGEMRVVDVHLGHIRQKLGQHHNITTVRGVGYRFEKETK